MSKYDKVALTRCDLEFIFKWVEDHNISRCDIDTFSPIFKKWEIEVLFPKSDDKEFFMPKNTRLLVRLRVVDEDRNIIRFNIKIMQENKVTEQISFSAMMQVWRTFEDYLESKKFLEDAKAGKNDMEISESDYNAAKKALEALNFESLEAAGKLLGLSEERVRQSIEKSFLPALQTACVDASRPLDERSEGLFDLMVTLYINVSLFLAYFKPETEKYKTKEQSSAKSVTKKPKKKAPNKKKKETVSVLNLSRYIQDIKEGREKLPRRKCPYAYKVRGHFRHYKSGKTVWVKEFTKNTEERRRARTIKLSGSKKRLKENHKKENGEKE